MYNDYLLNNAARYKKYYTRLAKELSSHLGIAVREDMIDIVDHHRSHAISPVYFYGLHQKKEPVLLLSLDGAGDGKCASVSVWENGTVKEL